MQSSHLDNIVLRADEKVSRRSVLASVVGGTALHLLGRLPHHGSGQAPEPRRSSSAGPRRLCPKDPATQSSLATAKAALAAGKKKVRLSPKGCLTFTVTTSGGTTTNTIAAAGTAVMVVTRQGGRLEQKLDADLDGFFELDRVVKRGSTLTSTETEYDPKSKKAIARLKMTQTGSVTHVTVSEMVNGTLQPVDTFTVNGPDFDDPVTTADTGTRSPSAGGCSAAQLTELKKKFNSAINVGLSCMRHYNATEILLDVIFSYVGRDLVFGCIPKCPNKNQCTGTTPPGSINDPSQPVEIDLPPLFFSGKLTDYDRESVLWHEFLHSALGLHHRDSPNSPRFFEKDRVYACQTLCFARNYDAHHSSPTKCSCAVCLKTTKCDKRCGIYPDCNPTFGFICPCPVGPNAFKEFPTCSECTVKCPTGLACFGYAYCIPRSVNCTPVTCP